MVNVINFKKGDKVAFIKAWDMKGTVSVRRAIVHSCGKKLARFMDAVSGEMFGAEIISMSFVGFNGFVVVADATDETLMAAALDLAAKIDAHQRKHFDACLAHNSNAGVGYSNTIKANIEALHEPRAEWLHDLRRS